MHSKIRNITFFLIWGLCSPVLSINQYKKTLFDEIFGAIGSSTIVCLLSKHVGAKIYSYRKFITTDSPTQENQALVQMVQTEAGIPAKFCVPIVGTINFNCSTAHACAGPDGIYISKKFQEMHYQRKRSIFFHEAIHVKYNDEVVHFIFSACTALIFGVTTIILLHEIVKEFYRKEISLPSLLLLKMITYLALPYSTFTISNALCRYRERRADREGGYASKCWICFFAYYVDKGDTRDKEGYIGQDEGIYILKDLYNDGQLCTRCSQLPSKSKDEVSTMLLEEATRLHVAL